MFAALTLLLLVVLAGQNTFTGFLSTLFQSRPACSRMRQASDRGDHQSLIGRAAAQRAAPVRVDLAISDYPTTQDGTLTLTIIFTNVTVGTVPFIYSGGIPFNNTTPDGFGIVTGTAPLPPPGSNVTFVPESNVRLLVPLQSCVEIISLNVSQLQQFGIQPGTPIRAYYRNSNVGAILPGTGTVYSDMGLWVGSTESRSQSVPVPQPTQ